MNLETQIFAVSFETVCKESQVTLQPVVLRRSVHVLVGPFRHHVGELPEDDIDTETQYDVGEEREP